MRKLLFTLLLACALPASAHKPSDSYLTLDVRQTHIDGRWDIALRDLDYAIGLDADGNGRLTWDEVRSRHGAIAAYALARLRLAIEDRACTLRAGEQLVDRHTDGSYTALYFSASCPRAGSALKVDYRLFADLDPQHKGLLQLRAGGRSSSAVFGVDQPAQTLALSGVPAWRSFAAFVQDGVFHIWRGFDHILFLVSLLLPAVLVRGADGWQAAPAFRAAAADVVKVVTAFTLAHSLTLAAATLGVVTLPSRLVESAIAASVVIAALNNLFPLVRGRRWLAAFGFGLVHGFGFAAVLTDLGLPGSALAAALAGFNVGVEVGQLALVAAFLPLAFLLRASWFYRRVVLTGGSLATAGTAAVWFAERAF